MTAPRDGERLGLFDRMPAPWSADPEPQDTVPPAWHASPGWRRLLGWSAISAPVALLLTAGIVVGPQGMNLLSSTALSLLDPVVPVALAVLGALVALGTGDRRTDDRRLFMVGCLDALITALVVSAGVTWAIVASDPSIMGPVWRVVVVCGVCAATSLVLPAGTSPTPGTASSRVAELGVLLPLVAGGMLLVSFRAGSVLEAATLLAQALGVSFILAAAGWLLLTRATSETEERVLAIGVMLLVGGAAAALSLSALLGGLVAGLVWRVAEGQPLDMLRRDVLFARHPLLVLVLLVAGARADFTPVSLGLAAAYLASRVAGKIVSGRAARRALGASRPRDLSFHLLPPGAFGVAFVMNAAGELGADGPAALTAVVVGTVGSELVALMLSRRGAAA
jgi:hypothetical protein